MRLVSENPPSASRYPESEEKEETISTKYVYNLLFKKFFVPPIAETKILKHGVTSETVQKLYELPFQINYDTKITMSQCKIILKSLATTMFFLVLDPNVLTTIVCPQCLADTRSLEHLLVRYSSAIALWKTFQNWWTNKTKRQLTSYSMILYGVFDITEHRYSSNYVLIIATFFYIPHAAAYTTRSGSLSTVISYL